VESLSRIGQFPKSDINNPSRSLGMSQFSHIYSSTNSSTQKIMSRAGGFKYNLPLLSQYYRWWSITGTQPTAGGGRTAGVWSTTGESVRKVCMAIPSYRIYGTWNGINAPFIICPISLGGLTYSNGGNGGVIGGVYAYTNFGNTISHHETNSTLYTKEK
jgi:hypothetical protein